MLGYENRYLEYGEEIVAEKKQATAGQSVTALYEIIPAEGHKSAVLSLNNQPQGNPLATIKLRYKKWKSDKTDSLEHSVAASHIDLANTSDNFRFSAAVAELGLLVRDSKFKANANYPQLLSLAREAKGKDVLGYREKFIELVENARLMQELDKQ